MNSSCPICFDLFDGNGVVATPCGHIFHSKCIFKWIDSSKICPECRTKITRNCVIKLFFNTTHNETLPLYPKLQNDIDSKNAELKAKDAELALAHKKSQDLREHAAKFELQYLRSHQNYLEAQRDLDIARMQLKEMEKLESKIKKLARENVNLESQLTQFIQVQTILEGTQLEADEILRQQNISLTEEVSYQTAKNLANLCSILKRELFKVKEQKEQYKKKEDALLYQIGLKNAKYQKLLRSHSDLQKQFQLLSNASPHPVTCASNSANLPSTSTECKVAMQMTPISASSNGKKIITASTCNKDDENSKVTPISINFSERKRPVMKKVVLDKPKSTQTLSSVNQVALPFHKPMLQPLKRKFDKDDDSITRVGYNGLGGHERVVFARARELSIAKPYKKNPNVKKGK